MDQEQWNARFEKFESKLDRISEALATLARIDEKLLQQQDSLSKGYEKFRHQDEKIHNLNGAINVIGELARKNCGDISALKKALWMISAGVITGITTVVVSSAI